MNYQIPMKSGHLVTVDKEDYEKVSSIKWHFHQGYAINRNLEPYKFMHRFIFGMPAKGKCIDHINGNGLDNRKRNLREADRSLNGLNRHRLSKRNKSGSTGVRYHPELKKWRAILVINRKPIHLGVFPKKSDATKAYKKFKQETLKRSLS